MTFGTRLQELREACGLSRRDLAARVRVKPSYLEKIERGYNAPPAALTIQDMARALGSDDELFVLGGKVAPDMERALKCFPALVVAVRVLMGWDSDRLRAFLLSEGVEAAKLGWQGAHVKDDERRVSREPVTAELRRAVFHLDGHECVYCSSGTLLEVDHLQAHSLGGTNDLENLVTSCSRCNKKKGGGAAFVRVFGRFRLEVENAS